MWQENWKNNEISRKNKNNNLPVKGAVGARAPIIFDLVQVYVRVGHAGCENMHLLWREGVVLLSVINIPCDNNVFDA
jgi:hypothetical protein